MIVAYCPCSLRTPGDLIKQNVLILYTGDCEIFSPPGRARLEEPRTYNALANSKVLARVRNFLGVRKHSNLIIP